ncbi:MAG: chalcone isomerase family protein [Rhodoferax sp.]|uniref:chalcone isomerase family protein n=1 Tax=Rhodoferax sp. TaxID=50421 RepID=UPI00271605D8|nr:chalcone isomerase family protein [Rhodoferax sp.]MDO8450385.1 chalcone isomerase family protein [Rhodoferax sp.]
MNNLMARLLAGMLLALAAAGALAQPVELEGVKLEPAVQVGATTLQLNGAGVRTRVIFKVYVAGLYVPQKAGDAATLLAQKGARRMAIIMLRNVDAETFAAALNDGLRSNHTEAQFVAMKAQIDALNANLKAVGEVKKGDVIHFEFVPDAGTRVTVNGQVRGNVIPGEDFFTSVLRIWIGDKPVDGSLKKGLVGG